MEPLVAESLQLDEVNQGIELATSQVQKPLLVQSAQEQSIKEEAQVLEKAMSSAKASTSESERGKDKKEAESPSKKVPESPGKKKIPQSPKPKVAASPKLKVAESPVPNSQ